MNYAFALLSEPRRPWLDAEPLKQRFLARSNEVHPDRVHSAIIIRIVPAALCCAFLLFAGCVSNSRITPAELSDLRKKAEAGDRAAQLKVGQAYDFGNAGQRNYSEAARWYQLAADQGDATAQNNLGSLYERGLGMPTNHVKAAELYRKSAEQGFALAQNSLGRSYDFGLGVPTNFAEANAWYLRAAEQGDPEAMFNLGVNYGIGRGVKKDQLRAFMWLDLARSLTQQSSNLNTKWIIRKYFDDLKKLLTPEQIRAGEQMSAQWYKDHIKNRK
jgi:TPR repeat protein